MYQSSLGINFSRRIEKEVYGLLLHQLEEVKPNAFHHCSSSIFANEGKWYAQAQHVFTTSSVVAGE